MSPRIRPIFEAVNNSVWGVDSDQLSMLYVASYTAAAGDSKTPGSLFRLISTAGGAQERRLVGGSQIVAQRVAQRLGRRVLLRTPVRGLAVTATGARVKTDGLTIDAKRVIVAVPPPLALEITRGLSRRRSQLLAPR